MGERMKGKKPLFSVCRSSIIIRSSVTVEVYIIPCEEYQIEGSFANQSCTFFNSKKKLVVEIRRKVIRAFSVWMASFMLAMESVEMPKDAKGIDRDAEAERRSLMPAKDAKPTPTANGNRLRSA
ncbi:protein LURP-one-related 5-like [Forsythia ovata]|uniref:Protein LURP-one-related 5-like n=1 Tax=Forsythia ovata TaxID=205694 RepID=A0ABD1T4F9_9LAMI